MYEAIDDPYTYKSTSVLKNRLNLRDQSALDDFEAESTAQRFSEPLPAGRLSVAHYCAVHRHIFGDVYTWAGRFRSVRIAKGGSMFCYPEYITREMRRVFAELHAAKGLRGLSIDEFASGAAHFLADLNAIHPFRDGNGRSQLAFLALVADQAGHSLDLDSLEPESFLDAMIQSFSGKERALAGEIRQLLA